ncbi:putative cysteine desulfurase [Octadecabacter antarcticus 307]|uniref:Putative cysteine desulfurase n=1 Tax=Octadecabacter antarcticus 307 TaxID=391626 RepID=M9RAV9_9RHOB|nr:aminotransferase class V-fold PLP-dependent enzyme [Octadecabacter antarcticus]AGI67461.1 putative cysteine desulfurase [Octadecabacter antarcticus 307]
MSPLEEFANSLRQPELKIRIQKGLIGDDIVIDGPYGPKQMIYADYVASGRALTQVEDFLRYVVLPYYANSHTQASYCGNFITRLREDARAEISRLTGAGPDNSVIFTGSGSTAGINHIVSLLDFEAERASGRRAVVLVGPYEHHSNLLPWRECGADVIEIPEGAEGGPDMVALKQALTASCDANLIVGAFSAASNVTGIVTDVDAVTRMLKSHRAFAIWDYGCAGPYIPMQLNVGTDCEKDAIVFSTHKFAGGPGASGVTLIRNTIVRNKRPSRPGGGTVSFVSPWGHSYSTNVTAREEGGTPNITGDIRAALVLMIKVALGQQWLTERQNDLRRRAEKVWLQNSRIELLGNREASEVLPIFSFRIRTKNGGLVHHQLFTKMLSDVYGVQARGGCACAGAYGHRLLDMQKAESDSIFSAIQAGVETEKPGWVRLNLSALMSDEKVDAIISGVDTLAKNASRYFDDYEADTATARFTHKEVAGEIPQL